VFHLVEAASGSWLASRLMAGAKKLTLKAPSVDESCEWTIALREAIAHTVARHARQSGAG
jgi:hypothetical protein